MPCASSPGFLLPGREDDRGTWYFSAAFLVDGCALRSSRTRPQETVPGYMGRGPRPAVLSWAPPRWGPPLFLLLGYLASQRSLHSDGAGTSPDLGLRWKPPWQTDPMPNPLIWQLPVIKVGFTSVIIFLFTFSMCSECRWEKQVPFIGDALKNISRNKTSAV